MAEEAPTKRKRFTEEQTEEQIVAILREAAAAPGAGRATARRHGVTETTLYRWRAKYGGMPTSDVRRLRQLEDENARLEKLVADLSLDVAMLKGVAGRSW